MKGKVLIIEDDADTCQALCVRLKAAGYEMLVATDGTVAIKTAREGHPDLILLDLGLPAGDGLTVLHRLKQMAPLQNVPVIVFSARDPSVYRDRALQAGAVAFLPKPVDNEELLSTLAKYAPQHVKEKPGTPKILIVEDDTDTRHGLALRLQANGYAVIEAEDAITALGIAVKQNPSLILLDIGLPGGDGFLFMKRFKLHTSLTHVPIVVLSARGAQENKERALSAGAVAFLQKPADNETLLATIQEALGAR